MAIKKEISIAMVKKIAQEELGRYVDDRLNEKTLRKTIREQLDNTGKKLVFGHLGLKWNHWNNTWELDSYGSFENVLRKQKSLIENIGIEVMCELIKEVTPEDVLSSLKEKEKNELRKIYRETLMNTFKEEVQSLAEQHGKQYAQTLFQQYISESEQVENLEGDI